MITVDIMAADGMTFGLKRDYTSSKTDAVLYSPTGAVLKVSLSSKPDADIEEIIKEIREHWNEWYPTTEELFKANTPRDPEDVKRQRKAAGHCVECGDAGEWVQAVLTCRNGHGRICG